MKKLLFLIPLFFSSFSNAVVCPGGQIDSGGVCVSACSILKGDTRTYTYDSYIWGDAPTSFCFGSRSGSAACKMSSSGSIVSNIPAGSRFWSRSFTFTGAECSFGEINRFFGDTPEDLPDNRGDLNQNGVPDADEDFDGDGIKNSEDTTPFQDDNLPKAQDLNGDGIPDNLETIYEKLQENTPEIVKCDSANDWQCNSYSTSIIELARNNRELARIIRNSSLSSLDAATLEYHMQRLKQHDYEQAQFTRRNVDSLKDSIDHRLSQLGGNIVQAEDAVYRQNIKFSNLEKSLDEHASEVSENFRQVKGIANSNLSYSQDVYNTTNDLKVDMAEIYRRTAEIINKLNSSDGSFGLTQTQKNQLKNAAKANANQKLLKEMKVELQNTSQTLGFVMDGNNRLYGGLQQNANMISSIADDVSLNLDSKFAQLSDQIAAISSGSSTIDLTGVENSISELSGKIDSLEDGTDTSPVGGSCSSSFTCSGNAYECYLARQAFETKCAVLEENDDLLGTDTANSTLEDLSDVMNHYLDNLGDDLETTSKSKGDGKSIYLPETDVSDLLNTYNQDNGGLDFDSNSCPEPIHLDFVLAGVKQVNIELSLEWLCELALYVRAMLMLGAAMISGRIWFQNY